MSSTQRALNQFTRTLKRGEFVETPTIRLATDKRKSVVIPDGIPVFDTTIMALFVGDGKTLGGVPVGRSANVRVINNPLTEVHVQPEDEILVVDSGVSTTVVLPNAKTYSQRVFVIKNKPTNNHDVIIKSFGGSIDCKENYPITDSKSFVSDGNDWIAF